MKKMKKLLSVFMSAVLAITMIPAIAMADTTASSATGEFLLSMHRKEALAETNFTVQLKSSAGNKNLVLKAAKGKELSEIFATGIANGSYTLTVSASKYLTYTQTLTFDGRCVHIDLYNYQSANDGLSGSSKLGVMPAGDMNGDGKINDTDAELTKNAIQKNNTAYDISGNGTVDLDDVAFVVRNAGTTVQATPMRTVSSTALKNQANVSATSGTSLTGDASSLLAQNADGGSVSLKPSNSSKITESNPVEVKIEAKSQTTGIDAKSQALVIAPPENSNNTIAAGTVEVKALDDSGNEVTIQGTIGGTSAKSSGAVEKANAKAAASAKNADGVTDVSNTEAKNHYAIQANEITVENDGTVVVNLGTRVAIKKVTIRVTATANQNNLAEIAKVEFLSDFAERIGEPQLSIPTVKTVSNTNADGQGYKNITITWTPQTNVSGYEVSVSGPGYNKTALTTKTTHTFQGDSFNGTVKSFNVYDVKVRSVSGDWRSSWSDVYKHECTCTNKPPAPQYVSVTSLVERLKVSWNCKFDAEWYTLYYREKSGAGDYAKIENITTTNYSLAGLEPGAYYQVYVVAHNRNGASPKSLIAEGKTLSSNLTRMPKFDLLNVNDSEGMATTGIESVTGEKNKTYEIRTASGTVNQSKATYENWKAILDNNADSYLYIPDWDSGVAYANFRGPKIKLKQRADVDTFRISPSDKVSQPSLFGAQIRYINYDKNGAYETVGASIATKYDSDNHKYYEIIANNKINSDYFELRLRTLNTAPITIQELKIYNYNSLDDDIEAIFADSMRTMLKDGVTANDVQALIDRSNTIDPISGEYHPHHASQMSELNYAMDIIKNGAHQVDYVRVNNQITSKGEPSSGFAQALSDYQPLGYVAGEGETLVVYVTDEAGKTSRGAAASLNLICTQMYPEVTAWQKSVALKAGRNEILIPKVSSLSQEHGGALYLQYTGNKGYNQYVVRVVGATKIPVLRVNGLTGTERRTAIEQYVKELKTYSTNVQATHNSQHRDSDIATLKYSYDAKTCIANNTDILLNNMMYSFPATQVNSALGASSTDATRADKLEKALEAMETQIDYFYQFKGLNKAATDNNRYPMLHLNIRYHRMFTGAFMYAAGKHIGIGWGSISESFNLTPVKTNDLGQRTEGNMSGWGIAHEIGHCINAAAYQRVEVTNNVYAQLAKAASSGETSSAFRANYERVYAGVVAGNVHHNGDLKVQLAQYWQLHLAYDNNYAFKKFNTIEEQQNGLFYARMETYMRDRSKAPVAFIGNPSGDQLFMQAACAAAKKNVLGYFRAWGYTPNAQTVQYAANFPVEERQIQYIDDDARLWRLQGGKTMSTGTKVTASITNATKKRINGNAVKINLANNNTATGAMLGYEIKRYSGSKIVNADGTDNGKVVGFVTASKTSFTDILSTENNKAFSYEITAFDKYLNATETVQLDEVKVCHDGSIDKSEWTATSTTATSKQDTVVEGDPNDPDSGSVGETGTVPDAKVESAAKHVLDNNANTIFCAEGGKTAATRPNVVLDLGGTKQVTALKFTPAKKSYSGNASDNFEDSAMNSLRPYGYKIELSQDGTTWSTVKEGSLYKNADMNKPSTWIPQSDIIVNDDSTVDENKSITIYFSKRDSYGALEPYMTTYDAAYVRLTATNMSAFAAAEIDILGPTNDNVDLPESLVSGGYGNLLSNFQYGPDAKNDVIPAGSRVIYGEYKGDPAYNVVVLQDQNGNVIDGQFIILADVPEQGMLGETSNGRWVFWVEDKIKTDSNGDKYNEMTEFASVKKVQAKLYRVQDAVTLAGQRVTSTSLTLNIPSAKPNVTLTNDTKTSSVASNKASQMYTMRDDKAINDEGNLVFDSDATIETQELEGAVADTATASQIQVSSENVDAKYASTDNEGTAQVSQLTSIEAAEKANAGQIAEMFADSGNLDVDQAELKSVDSGFTFKVNPSSIAIASEGAFKFDPQLDSNTKIAVKGLTNAKSGNLTYNGSYTDSKGLVHIFVIARTGVLANCVTTQANMSFTGTISGMSHRVKGVANYIRDINGDYEAPVVTQIGDNAVDFFAYRPSAPSTAAQPQQITSVKVSPDSYAYTKKTIKPKLVVKAGNTVLKEGTNYTVKYSATCKKIGTYKVTVTGIGAYTGTKTVSFKIVPKGTSLKKLTSKKKKTMVASWTKQTTETTGYKIRYSLKKTMSGSKSVTVNKAKTTKTTIKKLKSKKTYYVQISTFKKVGKTIYQSAWSKAKKIKIK